MAGGHRAKTAAGGKSRRAKGRHRATPEHRVARGWLGAGAITLGVGAALASGSGVAHADGTGPDSSTGPSASSRSTGSAASPGPRTSPERASRGPSNATRESGGIAHRGADRVVADDEGPLRLAIAEECRQAVSGRHRLEYRATPFARQRQNQADDGGTIRYGFPPIAGNHSGRSDRFVRSSTVAGEPVGPFRAPSSGGCGGCGAQRPRCHFP